MELKKRKPELPIYEIMINDNDETGIRFISLVDDPAIEIKGMYFAKKKKFIFYDKPKYNKLTGEWEGIHPNCRCTIEGEGLEEEWKLGPDPCDICLEKKAKFERAQNRAKERNKRKADKKEKGNSSRPGSRSFTSELMFSDDEQQIIVAPALIPDMEIYRKDESGEYYVTFPVSTIKKMVEKFNRNNNNKSINVDHSSEMVSAYVMENWIIEDSYYDKAKYYGFDLPVGTWMVMVKVLDTKFWNERVKGEGKYGFSIEGLLGQKLIEMCKEDEVCGCGNHQLSIEQMIDDLNDDDLNDLLNEIKTSK